MTNNDADFDSWFDALAGSVLDKTGVTFRCMDSVREDYDQGRNAFDVADEIAAEYSTDD